MLVRDDDDSAGPHETASNRLKKKGFEEEALPWLDAVYRFALRLTGGRASEAEDLVQETYLRAYRAWETFRPGTNARSWLFTIARNVFLRERQVAGRLPETHASELDVDLDVLASVNLFEAEAEDPSKRFFSSFIDEEVVRAVDALPNEFREAIVLSDIEGLNYSEIAQVLQIPKGTVKSRIFRGRRQLQQTLHDYAHEMGYVRGETDV